MNINLLQTFIMLVKDDLNFTRAAKHLGVTQSAVTKNIKKLEALIGSPLFLRRGRVYYQLSDKGKAILPVARNIMEQMHHLRPDQPTLSEPPAQKPTFRH